MPTITLEGKVYRVLGHQTPETVEADELPTQAAHYRKMGITDVYNLADNTGWFYATVAVNGVEVVRIG